jgi:hypothetical protein
MKKAGFAITLLCLAGLFANLAAQKRPLTQGMKWEGFDASQQKAKAAKEQLNILFSERQYDSAISYCNSDKGKALWYGDLEMAKATAYWHLGDKTTAYQYVQKSADYDLSLNGGGGHPFQMLYNYDFGNALPSDTFLERIIINKVTDYYLALSYYPDRYTGLKLMLLDYRAQKLLHKHMHALSKAQTPDQKNTLVRQYLLDKEEMDEQFIALLQENGKLFSRHDIGPASEKQFSMIRNFKKQEHFDMCNPLLYQAMLQQEANPEMYVEAVIAAEKLKEGNRDMAILKDSLCRVYKCKISIWDSTGTRLFSYATGDTSYIGKDTAYMQDVGGGIMKLRIKAPESKSTEKK